MDIAIFGLGYVGAVSAACLSKAGHTVVGVDLNEGKVEVINAGKSPVIERGVCLMIAQEVAEGTSSLRMDRTAKTAKTSSDEGRLRATTDPRMAIRDSELALVCVGTPSHGNGDLDLSHVRRVCRDLAEALRTKVGFVAIVIRSTILPGTLRNIIIPTLEGGSGRRAALGREAGADPDGVSPKAVREAGDPSSAPTT